MFTKLLKRFGYIKNEPGTVVLSIDDVEVIAEALEIYQARLPNRQYGYFTEAASAAKEKINKVKPGVFAKFMKP